MSTTPDEQIEKAIIVIRNHRVMLDSDLARIYAVTTKQLNQQVKRNFDRFPDDFMFQVTEIEGQSLRSQSVTSKIGRGGRRYLPYVFTEHGVLMLGNVLSSPVAINASIQIVRAFISLRKILTSQADLIRRLDVLERKYDHQFKIVFDTVRQLTLIPEPSRKRIGIKQED